LLHETVCFEVLLPFSQSLPTTDKIITIKYSAKASPKRELLPEKDLIGPVQIWEKKKLHFPLIQICCAILTLEVPAELLTAA
jgi:hypothetical protein